MKTRNYVNCCRRFALHGFLSPQLGGPTPCSAFMVPAGTTLEEYQRLEAGSIEYAAVRPFESLDMNATNHWQINQQTKGWLRELGRGGFSYGDWVHPIPGFDGDGVITTLIGNHQYRHINQWQSAAWSAIDHVTSLSALLATVQDIYKRRAFAASEFYDRWKLAYVLKTSWKAEDPERRAYDIYVPDHEWVERHGTFGPQQFRIQV